MAASQQKVADALCVHLLSAPLRGVRTDVSDMTAESPHMLLEPLSIRTRIFLVFGSAQMRSSIAPNDRHVG
jgi:hypothetical protein